jgi:hypothetical protein
MVPAVPSQSRLTPDFLTHSIPATAVPDRWRFSPRPEHLVMGDDLVLRLLYPEQLPKFGGLVALPLRMISVCGSNRLTIFSGNCVNPLNTLAFVCLMEEFPGAVSFGSTLRQIVARGKAPASPTPPGPQSRSATERRR